MFETNQRSPGQNQNGAQFCKLQKPGGFQGIAHPWKSQLLRLCKTLHLRFSPSSSNMFENPKLLLTILGISAAVLLAGFILMPTGAATLCTRFGQTVGGVKQDCRRCTSSKPCPCGGGGNNAGMLFRLDLVCADECSLEGTAISKIAPAVYLF